MLQEVIVLEPDPEQRMILRTLLERDGFRVIEAEGPQRLQDVLRASKARTVLCPPDAAMRFGGLVESLRIQRPDLDVLTPISYGSALLEGAAERDALAELSRDALKLLSVLAEEGTRRPAAAERLGTLSELTAIKLGLGRLQTEVCGAAAGLVALGPSLAAFRFSAVAEEAATAAEGGLSRELAASVAALSALRCPYDLRPVLEGVDEQYDGRGRPRGLQGEQIPLASRVIAVVREYAQRLAQGQDAAVASEAVRAKIGSAFDPRVVDAFFQALRDESYLERMQGGGTGARVLLADGDQASLAIAELRLRSAGFQVSVAPDGNKAFEMATDNPPDVLIADTVLPRVDGISLLLKLRRDARAKDVPVIFTSSRTDAGLLNKALKLGAKDVLAKPVNFEILVAKLRTLSSSVQVGQQQSSGMLGDLDEMPLADFLQVLALGRKTVKVEVNSSGGQGEIYFDAGAPVAAFSGALEGVNAFSEILRWTDGTFAMINAAAAPDVNLHHTLDALVLQTTWERDQARAPSGQGQGQGEDFGVTAALKNPFPAGAPQNPYEADDYEEENPYADVETYEEPSPYGPPGVPEPPARPYAPPAVPAPPAPLPQAFPSAPFDPQGQGTPTIGFDDDEEGDGGDFGQTADHLNPFSL